jgi:hypothetical protein
VDRGAAFLIIGASIARQFEFLQRVWVNDGDFVGLGTEKDPLIAANDGTGTFTIPAQTVAPAGEGLPRLVTTRAGEDCFIPGIRRCNGSPKANEGPAQYRPSPTLYDPRRTLGSSLGRTPPTGPAAKVRVRTLTSGEHRGE